MTRPATPPRRRRAAPDPARARTDFRFRPGRTQLKARTGSSGLIGSAGIRRLKVRTGRPLSRTGIRTKNSRARTPLPPAARPPTGRLPLTSGLFLWFVCAIVHDRCSRPQSASAQLFAKSRPEAATELFGHGAVGQGWRLLAALAALLKNSTLPKRLSRKPVGVLRTFPPGNPASPARSARACSSRTDRTWRPVR